MRRDLIKCELEELEVGKSKMVAWEAVTRWSEDSFEIGTWGTTACRTLADTLDRLCALRNVAEVTQ
jgi:hypothetical protein